MSSLEVIYAVLSVLGGVLSALFIGQVWSTLHAARKWFEQHTEKSTPDLLAEMRAFLDSSPSEEELERVREKLDEARQ